MAEFCERALTKRLRTRVFLRHGRLKRRGPHSRENPRKCGAARCFSASKNARWGLLPKL